LPLDEIESLGERLDRFWQRFSQKTRTKTRDTSRYGLEYLSGLLRLETNRTMAQLGRMANIAEQNMHHFMSNSPWSGAGLINTVQDEISQCSEFQQGSVLILDESADDKAGLHAVGASRQYNGRRGKVDLCQVGVFVSLANQGFNCWVDGEVFIPEVWFSEAYADQRQQAGIPAERTFQTKPQLGWQMIQRVQARGLPFEAVAFDTLYGQNPWLRDQIAGADLQYYADVPASLRVYLERPVIGWPEAKRGRKAKQQRVLSPRTYRVEQIARLNDTTWQTITLRAHERGQLIADFAARRVWTVRDDLTVVEEWLLIRREGSKHTYTLSNASLDTPLTRMAARKSQRYFIERSNQDAKSEFGWDEFQATKLLAWEHQLALTILAHWFITETRLDWARRFQCDPTLLVQYEVEVLPTLSVANVRAMLRAALPLPQLSPHQAADLVVKHLDNRVRSRKSRLKRLASP
jgi:SRSO17 transposase